jgi:hypothetical protein
LIFDSEIQRKEGMAFIPGELEVCVILIFRRAAILKLREEAARALLEDEPGDRKGENIDSVVLCVFSV